MITSFGPAACEDLPGQELTGGSVPASRQPGWTVAGIRLKLSGTGLFHNRSTRYSARRGSVRVHRSSLGFQCVQVGLAGQASICPDGTLNDVMDFWGSLRAFAGTENGIWRVIDA